MIFYFVNFALKCWQPWPFCTQSSLNLCSLIRYQSFNYVLIWSVHFLINNNSISDFMHFYCLFIYLFICLLCAENSNFLFLKSDKNIPNEKDWKMAWLSKKKINTVLIYGITVCLCIIDKKKNGCCYFLATLKFNIFLNLKKILLFICPSISNRVIRVAKMDHLIGKSDIEYSNCDIQRCY